MNDPLTPMRHLRPPRPVRVLVNALVTLVLRSPWHGTRSDRILLLTFTGSRSGKEFATPLRYQQEGETVRMVVVYPWRKNLVDEATVRVLLRGRVHPGTAAVLPQGDGGAAVSVHLSVSGYVHSRDHHHGGEHNG